MNFRFRDFKVYQEAKKLNLEIVKLSNSWHKDFDFLKNQIRRSSLSIVLNIAEGSSKRSDKDFNRYLENAMGSTNETISALEIALELKLISSEIFNNLDNAFAQLVNQLGGFSKKLLKS